MSKKLEHSPKFLQSLPQMHKLKKLLIKIPYSVLELIHLFIENEYLVKFDK